ncbi:Plant UBX domain-containing protein 16 [Cardamine amara subsp. amara]|uniref:Plant UBX domain-containing protein 16 n=1 Tax=Cardamine amara subsp. amara TaxID=228776 RepID=A0ABD1BQ17_CARAN
MERPMRRQISSFLKIAVGQTEEIAIQFLSVREYQQQQQPLTYEEIWESNPGPSDSGSDSRLSSLYRAPLDLLFDGSFEDAKTTSSKEDQWLLVNLQSMTEFSSHELNRDLWSNDAVSQAIKCSFILFQVYDHTKEGKKISTFYRINSASPVVLLIDPITGQKMRSWSGVIELQSFLEDLIKYSDAGPHEHITSLEKTCFSRNHASQVKDFDKSSAEVKTLFSSKKEETCPSRNHTPLGQEFEDQVVAPSWGPEFEEETRSPSIHSFWDFEYEESSEVEEEEEACASGYHTPLGQEFEDQVVAPSWGPEFEEETASVRSIHSSWDSECEESLEVEEEETYSSSYQIPSWVHEFEEKMILPEYEEENCLEEFPVLTEEPKGDCDRSLVCSLCVRFPDGRRKQRKFLKSEPIQLLWSFCYSHMEESKTKSFKLVEAIPGATKTLDYGANVTFDESGLANSMISVTWE